MPDIDQMIRCGEPTDRLANDRHDRSAHIRRTPVIIGYLVRNPSRHRALRSRQLLKTMVDYTYLHFNPTRQRPRQRW